MVAEGIRVPKGQADTTERTLRARGRCNWLVDWDPDTFEHVYCGTPASIHGLCSEHVWHRLGQEGDE